MAQNPITTSPQDTTIQLQDICIHEPPFYRCLILTLFKPLIKYCEHRSNLSLFRFEPHTLEGSTWKITITNYDEDDKGQRTNITETSFIWSLR